MGNNEHIAIISFTANGSLINEKVNKILMSKGYDCDSFYKGRCDKLYCDMNKNIAIDKGSNKILGSDNDSDFRFTEVKVSLHEWCKSSFKDSIGIIFIGAAAIAVRTIAPFIESKTKDPFVIVIDERADFVIPILSGHIGRGNEFANVLSQSLMSISVITTATDVNGVFAIDVFAKRRGLFIEDMKLAKEISARLLEGKEIGAVCDEELIGNMPKGIIGLNNICEAERFELGILISSYNYSPFKSTLKLIPQNIIIGIGCRKDTDTVLFESLIIDTLKVQNISIKAVKCIASIDIKKNEGCIINFAKKYGLAFVTYSCEELKAVPGEFKESEFVKCVTGVGNVCERAALAENGRTLILSKHSCNGITIAIAKEKRGISFE